MKSRWVASITLFITASMSFTACFGGGATSPATPVQAPSPTAVQAASSTATTAVVTTPDGRQILTAPPPFDPPTTNDNQTLTLAGSTTGPTTLDPALLRDAESSFIARQIFRGLVRLDDDLLPQPDLAEKIEISADGLSYTFTLRAGATFQDGAPLDATAVKESFDRATNPSLAGGDGSALPAATYLGDIEGGQERLSGKTASISGIEVVDSQTLNIRLAHPAANFLLKLSGPPAWIVDVRQSSSDTWWHVPNGSGAFVLSTWKAGGTLVLKRFDNFWGGRAALEEVDILGGSDALQPLNLYESSRIDLTDVPFYSIDRVLSPTDSLNSQLIVEPQLSTTFIVLNPNVAPFDDPNVRTAIALAFDRSKIARVMFDGKVTEADGLVPPGILNQDWPATLPQYDLAAAVARMKDEKSELVRPRIFEPGAGISVALKQVLQRDLNLDVDAIDVDWPVFSELLTDRTLPAYVLTWIADFPDPANFLTSMFHSNSPDNYLGYSNAAVDDLLDRAGVEQDGSRRSSLYLQAQQQIIGDGVLIPLYHDVEYMLVKPYVHGLKVTPIGILSLDDVWIDKSGD